MVTGFVCCSNVFMLSTIDGERVVVDDEFAAFSGGSGEWLLSEAMLNQGMTNTVETDTLKPTTKAERE